MNGRTGPCNGNGRGRRVKIMASRRSMAANAAKAPDAKKATANVAATNMIAARVGSVASTCK